MFLRPSSYWQKKLEESMRAMDDLSYHAFNYTVYTNSPSWIEKNDRLTYQSTELVGVDPDNVEVMEEEDQLLVRQKDEVLLRIDLPTELDRDSLTWDLKHGLFKLTGKKKVRDSRKVKRQS